MQNIKVKAYCLGLVGLFVVACGSGNSNSQTIIGPNGGTFVSVDGLLTITVPKDALTQDTEFTATAQMVETANGPMPSFKVGPAGTAFAVPVHVAIKLDEAAFQKQTEGGFRLVVTSDIEGEWQLLEDQMIEQVTKTVTGTLEHFSEVKAVFYCHANAPCPGGQICSGTKAADNKDIVKNCPVTDSFCGQCIKA